nr:intracellular protein transport protein USO1-like [Tanacetum cinerariifolium]
YRSGSTATVVESGSIPKKYASQEVVISEPTEELNLEKASESSTKEELQAKESKLEEVKVKLHELPLVQEELAKSTAEKEALDAVVVDLKS